MSFFKTIPNKTLFYGGWLLQALASSVLLIIVFDSKDLSKMPEPMLNWFLMVIFGTMILMYMMSNQFIKDGLKPRSSIT